MFFQRKKIPFFPGYRKYEPGSGVIFANNPNLEESLAGGGRRRRRRIYSYSMIL